MIKWTKQQNDTLNKAVKRWNAKLLREVKKNPRLIDVPGLKKYSVKELKEDITTANDLKRFVSSVDRSFKKGAWNIIESDFGALTTKHQLETFQINMRRANKKKEKLDKPILTDVDERINKVNYIPQYRGTFKDMSPSRWEKLLNSAHNLNLDSFESKRREELKRRYLKGLKNTLGGFAPELFDMIQMIPADIIASNMFDTHELGLDILYEEHVDVMARAEVILQSWFQRLDGKGIFENLPNLDVLPKETDGPEEGFDNEVIEEEENDMLEDLRNQWIY